MARNGTGSYLLPSGINPVVDGTVIDANWANTTLNDVATALTGSLPRDGQAPMTGTLKLADGSAANPGIAWNSDGATGFFRPATNTLAITAGGVEQVRWTSGNQLIGSTADTGERLQVTGATKLNGTLNVSGVVTADAAASFVGSVTAPTFVGALSGNASTATNVAWTGVTGKPTTIAGYGITDVNWVNVASKPTTIAGYGITDHNFANLNGKPTRMNWSEAGAFDNVVGQLAWRNYAQGHTIFDASASISPTGTAVNNRNSQNEWVPTHPTLMAWNGGQTYGVRVDSARAADTAGFAANATNAVYAGTAATANNLVSNPTLNGTTKVGRILADSGSQGAPAYSFTADGDTGMYSEGDGNLSFTVNGVHRGRFDAGGNLVVAGSFFGGGAGLTGYASGLTSGTTDNLNSTAINRRYNWGIQAFISNKGNNVYIANGNDYTQFVSTDGGAAAFSFHRTSGFAVNMGLDPDNVIRIGGWSAAANRFQFDMGGNFTAAGNVAAFSDARLKKNWVGVDEDFVERWAKVQSGTYDRVDQECTQVGVVAQDVQAILPHAVTEDKDGMLSLNYGGAAAVATVELAKEVVELRKRFDEQAVVLAKLLEKFE
jgi:hypothetical protein